MQLARYVHLHPESIDSSLQRLNCASQGIVEVDISPAVLSLLTSSAPEDVQRAVAEFPGVREAQDSDVFDVSSSGMNTALAFSLHTVLLSRNRITTTIGLVQFRNVVRLSLLGNRIYRVEDCEALSQLSSLQYLSLEYNPIAFLAHYRAHMLRICSWPESLHPKHCRLRRLDGRRVTAAEVDRASQCLQREKVSMCELVHRMRFLTLLVEAEKRIAVHHEMRRRGCVVQDIAACLSVEAVVTRCSVQMLAFVDNNAAAHMARQLMSGHCYMCAVNESVPSTSTSLVLVDETVKSESPLSPTTSGGQSLLRNPQQEALGAFCKDWSRDVFRRAMTSLDQNICTLLLNIAHALNEELTVMDVDRLNKLWLVQSAKIDSMNLFQPTEVRRSKPPIPQSAPNPTSRYTPQQITQPLTQETPAAPVTVDVHLVPLSPHDTPTSIEAPLPLPAPFCAASGRTSPEHALESLHRISPITTSPTERNRNESSFGNLSVTKSEHIDPQDSLFANEYVNSDMHNQLHLRESVILSTAQRCLKRQCLVKWTQRTRRRRLDVLCARFIQRRLTALLLARPTAHSICDALGLLPRAERKRVLLQHWREGARALYAPRALRHAHLFARWRWRAYEARAAAAIAAGQRRRVLGAAWDRWTAVMDTRANAKGGEASAEDRTRIAEACLAKNEASESSEGLSKDLATNPTQIDSVVVQPSVVQLVSVEVQAAAVQSVSVATQTATEEGDTQIADQNARREPAEAIAAMQADRSRLVDRIIAIELRANDEGARRQECEEEIANLRGKLTAMTIRESCMQSAISDYQREIGFLRDMVRALREERREMLCSITEQTH